MSKPGDIVEYIFGEFDKIKEENAEVNWSQTVTDYSNQLGMDRGAVRQIYIMWVAERSGIGTKNLTFIVPGDNQ